jgi:hypothetical protein
MNEAEILILKNQLVILGYLCNQNICELSKLDSDNDFRNILMKDNHQLTNAYKQTNTVLKQI